MSSNFLESEKLIEHLQKKRRTIRMMKEEAARLLKEPKSKDSKTQLQQEEVF